MLLVLDSNSQNKAHNVDGSVDDSWGLDNRRSRPYERRVKPRRRQGRNGAANADEQKRTRLDATKARRSMMRVGNGREHLYRWPRRRTDDGCEGAQTERVGWPEPKWEGGREGEPL